MTKSNVDDDFAQPFDDLVRVGPRPPADALAQIDALARRRRRLRVAGGGFGAATVLAASLALGVAVNHGPASSPTHRGTIQPADSVDWEELSGPALADALGLEPIPGGEVNDTPGCQGKDVETFQADPVMVYCYLAADYGITDPVEAHMLRWQLVGVSRSPDLTELAQLEVELHDVSVDNSEHPTPEKADQIFDLTDQTQTLQDELYPPE
jgi:hypothetical protein